MGLFDRLRGLLGAQTGESAVSSSPAASTTPDARDDDTRAFEASYNRRHSFWSAVGAVDNDVITHLISPQLLGGPSWPTTRQAYRVIRRPGSIIIATDGLSDPFSGVSGAGNGYEIELFVETPDIPADLLGGAGDVAPLSRSWAFELASHVASTVADAGGINGQFDRYKVLSMELPGVSQSHSIGAQVPAEFVTADDALGILIGHPEQDFPNEIDDMPLSPVKIVPLIIVTASELEVLRNGGAEARASLAGRLGATPGGHMSRLARR